MDEFVEIHSQQLQQLNIPSPLYYSLATQLQRTFVRQECERDDDSNVVTLDLERLVHASRENLSTPSVDATECGCIIVLPHVCSWDVIEDPRKGLWNALLELPSPVLVAVRNGLVDLWGETSDDKNNDPKDMETTGDRHQLMNQICDDRTWARVILFRHKNSVRAALPAPPYPPHLMVINDSDDTEADLVGPFPFIYHMNFCDNHATTYQQTQIDCSLAYLSPGPILEGKLPSIDLAPAYSVPDARTRAVRYCALLGNGAPSWCLTIVKDIFAEHVRKMHLVRQNRIELQSTEDTRITQAADSSERAPRDLKRIWKVYTDADDPLELAHPEAGLTSPRFALTKSLEEADIIYSFRSLFAPGKLRQFVEDHPNVLINQFPYEGAMVQKDHLARETLKQHGLPLPRWALETYDLDTQLTEFIGAALLASERGEDPLWIIKPARGTQSQGHVIVRGTAQVMKLIDSGGGSRVAQRYIKNPVCYDGRKIDCRCIVMMTCAKPGRPTLYMHNRVYFRIAGKQHSVAEASDLLDHERVLTAMHLLGDKAKPSESGELLPVDFKTIAKLEADYKEFGFDWKETILPQIYEMVRDLFNGMTLAFPAMSKSKQSRALYGVDIMFELEQNSVAAKLTEVTFCPANNAVCSAYERDEDLYQNYNNDTFGCLFLGLEADAITKL